jgi:hypothetical protein
LWLGWNGVDRIRVGIVAAVNGFGDDAEACEGETHDETFVVTVSEVKDVGSC